MKKNLLTKIVALSLAVVTALTPVSVSAAEKKVVTRDEVEATYVALGEKYEEDWDESDEMYAALNTDTYNYIKSLNGCYQENGAKIYTVLNGAEKTFKKTGKYSIIVGGKSAKKDCGTVVFKAPKTGTYKFTFVTKTNVLGSDIVIDPDGTALGVDAKFAKNGTYKCNKVYEKNGKVDKNPNCALLMITDEGFTGRYQTGGIGDYCDNYISRMQKITATVKMGKGETFEMYMRSPSAAMNEDPECAYNFRGVDVTISKVK